MRDHISAFGQTYHPDVVAMLQRVFCKARDARGVDADRVQADALARDIVDLFEHGVRDEGRLNVMINAIR